MSKQIDEKVVSMQFDNKNFESNVKTTISSLDRLKQALHLPGATKGLENVSAAASKCDLSPLGKSVETVQAKFSALQVMGVTALANITNAAVNAGKRMVSALAIDPIKTGFQEYETQIGAVQTILANTQHEGTNLQQVNRALDELNTYADKTIYNFTEMTRNIGTFTAAGVNLRTSVDSIKGIANLAAVSGSTSQQASTAMYQLSQALAAGKVSLMDWNSVVNAGMGGKVFQDALVRTSELLDTGAKKSIETYGSFRESLTKGEWLTTEVLTETLKQFAGAYSEADLIAQGFTEKQAKEIAQMAKTAEEAATKVKTFTQLWDTLKESAQSGWTQTWEILIGDFEEAKALLTEISETLGGIIGESADSRNKLLSEGLSSGWKQLLGAGIADEAGYIDAIQEVARQNGDAFDKMVADSDSFSDALKKGLSEGVISSDTLSDAVFKLKDKMNGMSSEELKAAGYTSEMVEQINALSAGLKDGSISMDEFVEKIMRPSGRENLIQALWNAFKGLMSVIKPIKEAFQEIFPPATGEQLYTLTERIRDFTEKLIISDETADRLKRTFKGVFSVFKIIVDVVSAVARVFFSLIESFAGVEGGILGITAVFGDWLSNIGEAVEKTGIFGSAVDKITGVISNFASKIKEAFSGSGFGEVGGFFGGLLEFIKSVSSAIGDALSSLGSSISEAFGKGDIFEVLNSGLIAGILLGIRKFVNGTTDIFDNAGGVLENVTGILDDVRGCFQAYQDQLKAGTLLKIAGAIAILAAAIFVISTIDADALARALGGITVLFGELIGSLALFTKLSADITGVVKACAAMTSISIAVLILAGALKAISSIDTEGIVKGLVAIGVLMAELSIFLNTAKFDGKITGTALGIVVLSAAILILAQAVKSFGSMNVDEILKGLVAIAALLFEISVFTKITGDAKHVISTAAAMILLGASMKIFASAVKDFGGMSWEEIGRGLLTMAGALAIIAVAMRAMPLNALVIGIGLAIVAGALKLLASTLSDFGGMSWEEIARGLVAMGGALAELAIALHLMNGTLAGSASLIIAAGALAIIAPVLKTLGGLSWEQIAKGLVALAGAFAVIGIAGMLLSPLIPTLLGLSAALALFGVAALAVGAGIALVGVGLTALAGAVATSATAIVAGITVIITGLLDLIPTIAEKLGEGIVAFAKVIGEYAPQLAESLLQLITGILDSLATYAPQIVDALLTFLIGVINSLADHTPTLIQAFANLIGKIFQGVVDALSSVDTSSLLQGVLAVGLMAVVARLLSGLITLIPSAMAGLVGVGILFAELSLILAAIGGLAQIPGLEWLISEGGNFLQTVGTAIGQFIGGIAGGIAQGVSASLPQVATDLSTFMTNIQPFIEGAKSIDPSMMEGVRSLAETILILTAADILEGLTSWLTGGSSLADFANQLVPFGEGLRDFGAAVAGVDTQAIVNSATAAKALAEVGNAIPSEGGLWGLLAGEKDLGSFGDKLVPFGEGMKSYGQAVAGINAEAIVSSATAAKALTEVANAIPAEGGLWQLLAGEQDLGSFGRKLVPFADGMKAYSLAATGINTEAIISSTAAAQAIVDVANAIPSEGGLWQLLAGEQDLASFGRKLVPFAEGMKTYSEAVLGINAEAITASASAAQAIVDVANAIPVEGGFWQLLAGEKDLASFGNKLVPFGNGMKAYGQAVAGIDMQSIVMSASAASAIVSVANAIPPEGGFWQLLAGERDLASFGAKLVPFGVGMKAYAQAVAGVDTASIIASSFAAKALVSVAKAIPVEGGIWDLITGDKDLGSFGKKLEPFGKGMKSYAESVAGIDMASIVASASAAKAMVSVANAIPTEGGIWNLITGEKDLGSFGKKLVPFGNAMKKYAESVAGIDAGAISSSVSAAKNMVNVAKAIPEDLNVSLSGDSITSLGTKLKSFGSAMVSYGQSVAGVDAGAIASSALAARQIVSLVNSMAGINTSGVQSFVNAINTLGTAQVSKFVNAFKSASSQLTSVGANMINSLVQGMRSRQGQLTSTANSMVNVLHTSLISKAPIFQSAGTAMMTNLVSGIDSKKSSVKSAVTSAVSEAASAIRGYHGSFYSAGSYVASGFASGMRSQNGAISAAASAMARAAEIATRAKLVINSPSKVFRKIGTSVPEGFAQGIGMLGSSIRQASISMGDEAIDGTKKAISRISDAINGDIDAQPTIRPVLDLSDVQSGAGAISGMFGSGMTLGMATNVNSMMNRRIQNRANEEVVSAIDKLHEDLSNLEKPSYIVDGITYDNGSQIADAVETLVRAAIVERRV